MKKKKFPLQVTWFLWRIQVKSPTQRAASIFNDKLCWIYLTNLNVLHVEAGKYRGKDNTLCYIITRRNIFCQALLGLYFTWEEVRKETCKVRKVFHKDNFGDFIKISILNRYIICLNMQCACIAYSAKACICGSSTGVLTINLFSLNVPFRDIKILFTHF